MNHEEFTRQVQNIILLAALTLPSGKEKDPVVGSMGGFPDTIEWLVMKINFLEPDDLDGLDEWQKYIIGKANAKIKEVLANA